MSERPVLSPESRAKLIELFDEDLAQLGAWTGLQLDCESFSRIAAKVSPEWRTSAGALLK
jgi:hypothetical protein